jgi:predicted enzyme related to lactoylglutathione lyase
MDLDGNLIVNLNSENPEALAAFYRDKIRLKPNPMMGESAFTVGSTAFVIDGHSEVKGKAKEPPRTLFNFSVDDVNAAKARLEGEGVEFLGPPSDDVISFATFVDPDGNYGQIFTMTGAPAGLEMLALTRSSEDVERLRTFLRDIVGLNDNFPDLGNPFLVGESSMYVGFHSDVHGQTQEPPRVLLNLPVKDLAAEQKRLEEQGVKFIRSAGKEAWGGVISTFLDPDGNYLQLMEYHGE